MQVISALSNSAAGAPNSRFSTTFEGVSTKTFHDSSRVPLLVRVLRTMLARWAPALQGAGPGTDLGPRVAPTHVEVGADLGLHRRSDHQPAAGGDARSWTA